MADRNRFQVEYVARIKIKGEHPTRRDFERLSYTADSGHDAVYVVVEEKDKKNAPVRYLQATWTARYASRPASEEEDEEEVAEDAPKNPIGFAP